ncbi:hypothetical protein [Saccharothrix sp. HUAS TT1]|uniref:hypothetical protein n=1 Tax=unclassified Saccharothrix TaxID=2593673 RepID=UPI00345B4FE6
MTDARGRRHVAGGRVASRLGGTALAGAVVVDPDEPAAVAVVTVDGRVLVAAPGSATRPPRIAHSEPVRSRVRTVAVSAGRRARPRPPEPE